MEKTPEIVAQENAAIQQALEEVRLAAEQHAQVSTKNAGKTGITESGEVSESHRELFLKSHKLMRAVRGPVDMIFSHFENVRTQSLQRSPITHLEFND
jgi:hypothetical protein